MLRRRAQLRHLPGVSAAGSRRRYNRGALGGHRSRGPPPRPPADGQPSMLQEITRCRVRWPGGELRYQTRPCGGSLRMGAWRIARRPRAPRSSHRGCPRPCRAARSASRPASPAPRSPSGTPGRASGTPARRSRPAAHRAAAPAGGIIPTNSARDMPRSAAITAGVGNSSGPRWAPRWAGRSGRGCRRVPWRSRRSTSRTRPRRRRCRACYRPPSGAHRREGARRSTNDSS